MNALEPARPISESYWVESPVFLAGEYPARPYDPQTTQLRLRDFLQAGFDTFLDLTVAGETEPYAPQLQSLAAELGLTITYQRFAIGDYGLPVPEQMQACLNAIDAALAAHHRVYLHCYGGIGRTGTTVGCHLVRRGLSGDEALRALAARWQSVPKSTRHPHSPETIEQENFISNWRG